MDKILNYIIKLTEENKIVWERIEPAYSNFKCIIGDYELFYQYRNITLQIYFDKSLIYKCKSEYLHTLLDYPEELNKLMGNFHLLDKGTMEMYCVPKS